MTLHAAFLSLAFLPPRAAAPPLYDAIRVHFVEAASLSAAVPVNAPPAKPKASSAPDSRRQAVAVKPILTEHETQALKPAESAAVAHAQSNAVGTEADAAPMHSGRVQEASAAGMAAVPAVVDTAFGADGAPAFIHREQPVYPMLARRMGREGKVVLKLLIDSRGNVQAVEIVEDGGYGFAEAAVAAVRKSTFLPALRNGERVTARAILPVRFRLR